jgi:multidrug efflux pump subunit AcrA (membrane-fusion protein)
MSQQVEVTTGLTNETYSEVTSGDLKEGDRVVVSSSTTASSSTTTNFGRDSGDFIAAPIFDGGGPPQGP